MLGGRGSIGNELEELPVKSIANYLRSGQTVHPIWQDEHPPSLKPQGMWGLENPQFKVCYLAKWKDYTSKAFIYLFIRQHV